MNDGWTAIILAAGLGKRMRSRKPKALHPSPGGLCCCTSSPPSAKPSRRRDATPATSPSSGTAPTQVEGRSRRRRAAGRPGRAARHRSRRRPGRAVAREQRPRPRAQRRYPARLARDHRRPHVAPPRSTAPTSRSSPPSVDDARGQGRLQRDAAGRVTGIVEEADADAATLAGDEVNVGVYCFRGDWLWPRLAAHRAQRRRRVLPDRPHRHGRGRRRRRRRRARRRSRRGARHQRPRAARPGRSHRARAHPPAPHARRRHHRRPGDDLHRRRRDRSAWTRRSTRTRTSAAGRPSARSATSAPAAKSSTPRVGDRCRVVSSVVEQSTLEDDVDVGPFSHLRAGAHIGSGVHIGNYAEVKNSRLGRNTKMGHFSYIGDAAVGDDVNIGAGTITCNFDGVRKHRPSSATAPSSAATRCSSRRSKIGAGARTGAGSVVNHDVPPNALAVGVPARIRRKKENSVD